jgi:hypothetical protein
LAAFVELVGNYLGPKGSDSATIRVGRQNQQCSRTYAQPPHFHDSAYKQAYDRTLGCSKHRHTIGHNGHGNVKKTCQ